MFDYIEREQEVNTRGSRVIPDKKNPETDSASCINAPSTTFPSPQSPQFDFPQVHLSRVYLCTITISFQQPYVCYHKS